MKGRVLLHLRIAHLDLARQLLRRRAPAGRLQFYASLNEKCRRRAAGLVCTGLIQRPHREERCLITPRIIAAVTGLRP